MSAFVFPFSGFPLLELPFSSVLLLPLSQGASVLFLQLVLVQIFGSLSVGAFRADEFRDLSCISPALFRGFHAPPSSSVGLVPLFLLQTVVFHLSAFLLFGAPFSFF